MKNREICNLMIADYLERLRMKKGIIIKDLAREAHISTKTYIRIKKGKDVRFSCYMALFQFYLMECGEDEFRKMVYEILEKSLKWKEELGG